MGSKMSFDKASIGYNKNELKTVMFNLSHDIIDVTIRNMRNHIGDLTDAIDSCWVGISADNFKANIKEVNEMIIEKMIKDFADCLKNLNNIMDESARLDYSLLRRKDSWL